MGVKMVKLLKLVLAIIILYFSVNIVCYSESIDINPEKIIKKINTNPQNVISGSVEKNVEMSLENCISLALGNNPDVNSAFHDIAIADTRIKQVWSNFFPTIGWQTSWAHIKQLQLSDALSRNLEYEYYILGQISLYQMIYDFGVTQNEATVKRLDYESYRKAFVETVNNVICQTKIAFYNVLYSFEKEEVAANTVDKYEQFYKQANAFYKVGLNPKVDVTIALSNLSQAKVQLIQAKTDVNSAIAQLNNIMGLPYLSKYKLKGELKYVKTDLSFEDAVSIAKESRPELKKAQIDVEKARQNWKLAKKSFFPYIDFQGQYQRGGKHWTSNDGWSVGFYLNFTNINAAYTKNYIDEMRYTYEKQLAQAKKLQNDIYLEIQNSYLKLNEKDNQIPVSLIQLKQAQENYDLSFGRYRVGVATPIELLEAEDTLKNSKLSYFAALYEYNAARSELEKSIGKNIKQNADIIELNN